MKNEIIEKLKKIGFDEDNYMGIVYILNNNKNTMKQMLDYLGKNENVSRNDIFEYALKITDTKPDIIEIVE